MCLSAQWPLVIIRGMLPISIPISILRRENAILCAVVPSFAVLSGEPEQEPQQAALLSTSSSPAMRPLRSQLLISSEILQLLPYHLCLWPISISTAQPTLLPDEGVSDLCSKRLFRSQTRDTQANVVCDTLFSLNLQAKNYSSIVGLLPSFSLCVSLLCVLGAAVAAR